MKEVSKEVLKNAANKLMFDLTDEQYDNLLAEFNVIISQMNIIGDIKGVDEATPMTFPFDVTNSYLRDDVPTAPLKKEEALRNAKDVVDDQIRLPRVVK